MNERMSAADQLAVIDEIITMPYAIIKDQQEKDANGRGFDIEE
ncbi:hypothetical protein WCX49_11770 [Sulfurimonas sp. HSL-1656]